MEENINNNKQIYDGNNQEGNNKTKIHKGYLILFLLVFFFSIIMYWTSSNGAAFSTIIVLFSPLIIPAFILICIPNVLITKYFKRNKNLKIFFYISCFLLFGVSFGAHFLSYTLIKLVIILFIINTSIETIICCNYAVEEKDKQINSGD